MTAPPAGPEYDVVLFDLGGVLVELTGVPVIIEWMEGSLTPSDLWHRWLTSPSVRRFETGRSSPEAFADAMVAEFSLPVAPGEFLHEYDIWVKGLYPGAVHLLQSLKPAYRLGILSNTNEIHWPRMRGEMGLGAHFDVCFVSYQMGLLKPDREVFQHVVEALDTAPGRILFLDDNQLNVDGALGVGLAARCVQGVCGAESALLELGLLPAPLAS